MKFPRPSTLDLLLRAGGQQQQQQEEDEHHHLVLSMVMVTLDNMAKGGIRDHVGGGFHRYSTDRVWCVPHFEKMMVSRGTSTS